MLAELSATLRRFIQDLEKESPSYRAHAQRRTFSNILSEQPLPPSLLAKKATPEKIKIIIKRSKQNEIVYRKLEYWKDVMQQKGNPSLRRHPGRSVLNRQGAEESSRGLAAATWGGVHVSDGRFP